MYHRQPTPATTCAIAVAHAAPATPSFSTIIKNRSSPILTIEEMTRKITGVLLSPSALITPDTILYRNVNGIAANIITIY